MILVIDNYDSFTWNLVHRLGELDPALEVGRDLAVVRHDQITPGEVEVLDAGRPPTRILISPGPGTPAEAGVSWGVVERFAGRVPILGVCLGHQCVAAGHGMEVQRHAVQVHGKTSLVHHDGKGIFRGVESPFEAMRYHSLVVREGSIPAGRASDGSRWVVSAWTDEVDERGNPRRVVMGLRRDRGARGGAMLEGVQFHPESFLTTEGPKLLANFLRGRGGEPGEDGAARALRGFGLHVRDEL